MSPVTIVGVNSRGFTGAESVQVSPDLFMPLSMAPLMRGSIGEPGSVLSSTDLWWLQLMARAKPGVSDEQARAALDVMLRAAIRGTMKVDKGGTLPRMEVEDGSRGLNQAAQDYSASLYVLLAMVSSVLLLACANMANLMLARAAVRQREMSVRLALGAGRWRILRQVLTESLLLSAAGGALGLLLGYSGRTLLPNLVASSWEDVEMNIPFHWKVFAFTAGITIGTGILFGIFPAWAATRAEIGSALKQGSQTASRRRKAWTGKSIVTFQVALSTLLVVAAVLFLRTLTKLIAIDPGFRTDHLLLFEISLPAKRYQPPKDVALHQARKSARRARYAAEAARPAIGKQARRFSRQMKKVQSVLGEHQDSVVARQAARDLGIGAHLAGENAFTYGLLHEREAHQASHLQAQSRHIWKHASRPRYRHWMH